MKSDRIEKLAKMLSDNGIAIKIEYNYNADIRKEDYTINLFDLAETMTWYILDELRKYKNIKNKKIRSNNEKD